MGLNAEELEIWKTKRKYTTIVFVYQSLLLGIEYSVTFLTLWPYLKDLVHPTQMKIYFSVISAAYLSGALPFQILLARISDKKKCIKRLMTVCNCLLIVGNILYSLPFSPLLLFFGRLIAGGGSMKPIMIGELARVYRPDILYKKLSMMGMAFTMGFVIGPCINIAFENVDFWIGNWHLNFENLPGIYLTVCFVVAQILVMVFVHDLSKEHDLKTDLELTKDNEVKTTAKISSRHIYPKSGYTNRMKSVFAQYVIIDDEFGNTLEEVGICTLQSGRQNSKTNLDSSYDEKSSLLPKKGSEPVLATVKKLFSNWDCVMIFGLTFIEMYISVTADMWLPLLILDTIPNGTILTMNLVVLGSCVLCAIGMITIMLKQVSSKQSYVLAVVSVSMLAGIVSVFLVLSQYNTSQPLNIIMWIIYCISFAFAITNEEVFFAGCLANLVDSRIQSITEGVRLAVERTGALVALLTSALIFDYVVIASSIYIVIIVLAVFCMLLRRKILSRPRVLIH